MVSRRRPERNHAPGLRLVAVAGALLAPLFGCAAHYQPTVPMRARTQDVEVELRSLKTGASREFTYGTRSTAPHTLGSGWLTVASRHPCSGGANLDQVLIDGVPTATGGTLTPGAHQLTARLDRAGGDFSLDLVVDVRLDEQGCLRAPAVSQLLPFVASKRPMLITSIVLDAANNLSGLRALTSFQLGVGLWAGPVLLAGHAGIGVATCESDVCGKDSDGRLRNGWAFPVAADARVKVASLPFGLLNNFIAVGMRYSFLPGWLPASAGERKMAAHGVQGVLSWSASEGLRGPFQHRERTAVYEFTVPIGIFVDPGASARTVVFAGGAGVRLLFGL